MLSSTISRTLLALTTQRYGIVIVTDWKLQREHLEPQLFTDQEQLPVAIRLLKESVQFMLFWSCNQLHPCYSKTLHTPYTIRTLRRCFARFPSHCMPQNSLRSPFQLRSSAARLIEDNRNTSCQRIRIRHNGIPEKERTRLLWLKAMSFIQSGNNINKQQAPNAHGSWFTLDAEETSVIASASACLAVRTRSHDTPLNCTPL